MKYKIGQKVRVKRIEGETSAGHYIFITDMKNHWDTITEIIEIIDDESVRLKCSGTNIGWNEDWITPAEFFTDDDFEI